MSEYAALKSGTDLRAVAMGEGALLTPDVAERIGSAFVTWFRTKHLKGDFQRQLTFAIGHDSRLTGPSLLAACAKGMASQGADVKAFGLCTTPAMFKCLVEAPPWADAAVMVTASHHPSNRNGFKFFTAKGGIDAKDLADIVALAEQNGPAMEVQASIEQQDYLKVYQEGLVRLVQEKLEDPVPCPLLGLHVVVDAGNGAGGFYADLLERMGATVDGSQFLEPDGTFPNHPPNPEDERAMQALSEAVVRHEADLGVIFDADCDRAAIVDANGLAINRNRLIALVSAMLLNVEQGLTIVTDSVTSSGLSKFIGSWGGEHYRYKRGYRNVIDEAKRLNEMGLNCPLAIETSGHAALRENDFLDDGMYLSTLLVCESMRLKREGQTISSMLEGLQEPAESAELRLSIHAKDFQATGRHLIETVLDYASDAEDWHIAPDNREGVRINFNLQHELDNAWFLLRLSVHDPVMALNVESDVPGGVKDILKQLYEVIEGTPDIDLTPIVRMIHDENA